MAPRRIPFETDALQALRALRAARNEQPAITLGYFADGCQYSLLGDVVGPYVHAIGRASSDGSTGLVVVEDGDAQRIATDESGRLWFHTLLPGASDAAALTFHSPTAVASIVVKASAGRLFQVRAIINFAVATDRFIHIFNATALPVDGTEPEWELLIPASAAYAQGADDFDPIDGIVLSSGIVLACSSTPGTLTITGAQVRFFGSYL